MAIQITCFRNVITAIGGTFSSVLDNYKDAVEIVFKPVLLGFKLFLALELCVLFLVVLNVLSILLLFGAQELRITEFLTDLYYSGQMLGITAWRAHLFLLTLCFLASTKND